MKSKSVFKSLFLFVTVLMLFSVSVFAEETPVEPAPESATTETPAPTPAPAPTPVLSGWVEQNGHWYFYNPKTHVMERNKIVGNKTGGYYYVGTDGIRVNDETTNLAVAFVRANTKSGQTASQKLNACVKAFIKKYKFKDIGFVKDTNASKMQGFANEFFKKKKGSCLGHASAVTYVAKVLGYKDSRVVFGVLSMHYKNYPNLSTNHGWAEVKKMTKEKKTKKIKVVKKGKNGKKKKKTKKITYYVTSPKYKVYDLTFKRRYPKKKLTDVTRKKYAYKLKQKKAFYLVLTNGTATWK